MKKAEHFHVFLGVKTSNLDLAKKVCEAFVGKSMQCWNGQSHGGDYCVAQNGGGEFDLRLNHHNDGSGWSWCLEDPVFPLVLSCWFADAANALPFMSRVKRFDLLEWKKGTELIR